MSGKQLLFTGSCVALVTPFRNGEVDYQSLDRLITFHLQNHTDAILVCGTTGESATLTEPERNEIVRFTVSRVDHRVPVIVGSGSNVTSHAITLSRDAEKCGADGLLLVTPYYNKTSQAGLVKHYEMIAGHTDLPCILYNVPSRTGMSISLETYQALSKVPNIVATKEASGNLSLASEIIKMCGEDLWVYSGEDKLDVSIMKAGAKGCISVLADVVPGLVHQMMDLCFANQYEKAEEIQSSLIPLLNALFMEVNPIPVKAAMKQLNLCSDELRMPLCPLNDEQQKELSNVLSSYHLI